MSLLETIRTAYEALRTRRMRSILTMLGILIGVAAVMLTVGLGQGAQARVLSQINSLGSNLLIVSPGSSTSSTGVRGGAGSATTLTNADATLLGNPAVCPDVVAVAPSSQSQQTLSAGTNTWTTSVVGSTQDWLSVRARTMQAGRFFDASDVANANRVAVVGATTAGNLWGLRDPVGQTVTVNGQNLTVIGELASAGATIGQDQDDTLVLPSTTYAQRVSTSANPQAVSAIYLEGASTDRLAAAYQEVTKALTVAHQVNSATQDFTVSSQQSLIQTASSTTAILTALLGGIAAISLLVGGIGVMNIMLVSVTERVHEIGLRKALGATPSTIRRQFLVEASMLGVMGGVLGLLLGVAGGQGLTNAVGFSIEPSPIAALGALVVSLIIGIAAGVYPAGRAARLSPIDALRSE